jgi:hypothetical protein
MWSWISGGFPCNNSEHLPCDSMQSVPREMHYSPALDTLIITPVSEVAQLRTTSLVHAVDLAVPTVPTPLVGADGDALDVLLNFSCPQTAGPGSTCAAAVQLRVSPNGGEFIQVGFTGVIGAAGKPVVVSIEHGSKSLDGAAVAPGCNVTNNSNIPRSNLPGVVVPAKNDAEGVAECTAACARTHGCVAWVFVRAGHQGGPRCALKDNTFCPNPLSDPCAGCRNADGTCGCVSGTMAGAPSRNPNACGGGGGGGKAGSFDVPYAATDAFDGRFAFRVLVDTSVIEVYAQEGRAIGTYMYIPQNAASTGVRVVASTAGVTATADVWAMGSAYAPGTP